MMFQDEEGNNMLAFSSGQKKVGLIQYLNSRQPPAQVNFLFSKTIISKQGKCVYKLYEFKLAPGQYHAALVSPLDPKSLTRINFKKENGVWQTTARSKEAKRLAKIFGEEIDRKKG